MNATKLVTYASESCKDFNIPDNAGEFSTYEEASKAAAKLVRQGYWVEAFDVESRELMAEWFPKD